MGPGFESLEVHQNKAGAPREGGSRLVLVHIVCDSEPRLFAAEQRKVQVRRPGRVHLTRSVLRRQGNRVPSAALVYIIYQAPAIVPFGYFIQLNSPLKCSRIKTNPTLPIDGSEKIWYNHIAK